MPDTLAGAAFFVVFLTPGFVSYLQHRRRLPQRSLSSTVELATFVTISIVTNAITAGLFSLYRWRWPSHAPNIDLMLSKGYAYVQARPGYMLAWALVLLTCSCFLALVIGTSTFAKTRLARLFAPQIVQVSSWFDLFGELNERQEEIFLGADLRDGSYVSGFLDRYNTDIDELPDRDLVLRSPISIKRQGEEADSEFDYLVLSARDIVRLHVKFVAIGAQPEPMDNSDPGATTEDSVVQGP